MTRNEAIPSAARWLVAVALGAFVVGGAITFVSRNAPAVVSAAVVKPVHSTTKRMPSYIARIEPIPPGSISAIAPLPASAPVVETVAATVSATIPATEPAVSADMFRVVGNGVNVRSSPSSKSGRVGAVSGGALVQLLAREGKWMLIDAGDVEGWVFGKYLEPAADTAVATIE